MATPPPAYPVRRRPLGVSILAVLVGLYGLLVVLSGLLLLVGSTLLSVFGRGPFGIGGLPLVVIGGVVFVLGVIILAAAVGLWHLRMWALVLALIVSFLELVSGAINGDLFGLVVALVIFVYLLAVHREFR